MGESSEDKLRQEYERGYKDGVEAVIYECGDWLDEDTLEHLREQTKL